MLIADSYLGHRNDPPVADRLADADPHRVVLSDTDRRRSRVRTETDDGKDLGVVVTRDLKDGDVLETEGGDLVVVELAAVEALVLDFADVDVPATTALELGHAVGNRHWNLAVRGSEALFLVTDSYQRMETTVEDLLPDGVTTYNETVSPTTFDDTGVDHSHVDDSYSHPHEHSDRSHTHSHRDNTRIHDHGDGSIDQDEK